VPEYKQRWGLFLETVPVGKRTALDDIRSIHKVCPPPAKRREETSVDPKNFKKWLQVGKSVEVKWDGEWWQAKVKKVRTDRLGVKPEWVFVSYVGGRQDEDEWIQMSSKRVRPPTNFFQDTSTGKNRS
jgi:hypothetical protein